MTYYYEKDFLLKKGYLSMKKVGFIGIKKYLLLCAPVSITDVAVVYENLFSLEGKYKIESKAIPFLGHIAFAALKGTPLLIILSSEKNITNPTFINFADVKSVNDETKLRSACCMSICTNKSDYKFTAASSVEYQIWIQAFEEAYKISRNALPSLNCTPSLIGGLVSNPGTNNNANFLNYSAGDNNNINNVNNITDNINLNHPYRSSFSGPTTSASLAGILANNNYSASRNSLIILPSNENETNSIKNNNDLLQSPHVSRASIKLPNSHNNSILNFPYNKSSLNINESSSLVNETQQQQQQPTLGRLFTNAPTRLENQSHILDDLTNQDDEEDESNLDTMDDTEANESSMMTESSIEPSELYSSYRNFNNSISHNSPRIYDYKYANDIRPNESMVNKDHNESFNVIKSNEPNNYSYGYNNNNNNNINNNSTNNVINYNEVRSSNSIKNNSVILQMPPSTPSQHKMNNDFNMMNVHDARSPHPTNQANLTHNLSHESDEDENDESNFETTTETESFSEYDTSSYNTFPSMGNNFVPASHITSRSSIRSFNNMNPIIDNKNHMRTRSNNSFHYVTASAK
ncbi:hypothetical protein PIROE2DRAFT_1637 [Piromyces sp. E2]|nr:hypothetical protein PIROE2DRAFT_1637 [Piromyces sp. E2]|eukprot:OUM70226.1 hypothetical protein PIROE2DRAFT_1637 [Piromyces sp. E2]